VSVSALVRGEAGDTRGIPDTPNFDALRVASVALCVLHLFSVLRFGWVSDDAFIAFRAVGNLVWGHGLVNNPPERVQAFTSPLWTLLLSLGYLALRNVYWVAVLSSLAASGGLGWLLLRDRERAARACIALALLTASRTFVTFSTSGLENPLSHFLLAAFALNELSTANGKEMRAFLLAGFLATNRLDHLLLVAPALVLHVYRGGIRTLFSRLLLGFVPLVAWLSFALVYYGFPWPNTAYAKLNLAVERRTLLAQGASYVLDAVLRDGVLVFVIVLALLFTLRRRTRVPGAAPLQSGVVLYVLYVLWTGGDFMGGRFFTGAFVLSTLILSETLARMPRTVVLTSLATAAIAARWAFDPLPVDVKTDCVVPPSGIVDERACYVEHTGVAQNLRAKKYETHPYFKQGREFRQGSERVVYDNLVGMAGFAAGPNVHIVDGYSLSDPLLARMRYDAKPDWRVGHFKRTLPKGYLESLREGRNLLEDPCLRALYDDLALVTRGPVWSRARLSAMWRLNVTRRACAEPK